MYECAREGEWPDHTGQVAPWRRGRPQDHRQRQPDGDGQTWSDGDKINAALLRSRRGVVATQANGGHDVECSRTAARRTTAGGTDATTKTNRCHRRIGLGHGPAAAPRQRPGAGHNREAGGSEAFPGRKIARVRALAVHLAASHAPTGLVIVRTPRAYRRPSRSGVAIGRARRRVAEDPCLPAPGRGARPRGSAD